MGNIWAQLQFMIGCEMYHSSPYHQQSNSVVEHSHRTINKIRGAALLDHHRLSWCNVLPAVQLTMNSAEHSAHTYPSGHLILETNLRLPVVAMCSSQAHLIQKGPCHTVNSHLGHMPNLGQAICVHPSLPSHQSLCARDLILAASTSRERAHKLDPQWQGPFEVTGVPHQTQMQSLRDGSHWFASW